MSIDRWMDRRYVHIYNEILKLKNLVTQSCLTLCDLMSCSLPGSSVHEISQARRLEWVAVSFSKGSSQPRDWTQVSCIADRFFTIWATREPLNTCIHLANHEEQISQVNDFSVCISMGRCKNLVSLISPWDICLCKGLCIQSTGYLILFFIQNSSQVTLLVGHWRGVWLNHWRVVSDALLFFVHIPF